MRKVYTGWKQEINWTFRYQFIAMKLLLARRFVVAPTTGLEYNAQYKDLSPTLFVALPSLLKDSIEALL